MVQRIVASDMTLWRSVIITNASGSKDSGSNPARVSGSNKMYCESYVALLFFVTCSCKMHLFKFHRMENKSLFILIYQLRYPASRPCGTPSASCTTRPTPASGSPSTASTQSTEWIRHTGKVTRDQRPFFKRIFAPTVKLAPTGKVGT
jgi:hypothetical protein